MSILWMLCKEKTLTSFPLSQVDVHLSQVWETWGEPHPVLVSTSSHAVQEALCLFCCTDSVYSNSCWGKLDLFKYELVLLPVFTKFKFHSILIRVSCFTITKSWIFTPRSCISFGHEAAALQQTITSAWLTWISHLYYCIILGVGWLARSLPQNGD